MNRSRPLKITEETTTGSIQYFSKNVGNAEARFERLFMKPRDLSQIFWENSIS